MEIDNKQWTKHRNNRVIQNLSKTRWQHEFISGRALSRKDKISVRIAIGLIVCELIQFNKGDRVLVYKNNNDSNLFLVFKTDDPQDGFKLSQATPRSFLTFDILTANDNKFKLSQTTRLSFDINDEKILFINLKNLKWE